MSARSTNASMYSSAAHIYCNPLSKSSLFMDSIDSVIHVLRWISGKRWLCKAQPYAFTLSFFKSVRTVCYKWLSRGRVNTSGEQRQAGIRWCLFLFFSSSQAPPAYISLFRQHRHKERLCSGPRYALINRSVVNRKMVVPLCATQWRRSRNSTFDVTK